MNLAELKTEISIHSDYKTLSDGEWDVKSTGRGLHKRSQVDFDWLEDLYPKKISVLRTRLIGEWDFSCKVSTDGKTLNSPAEILDAINAKMDEWHYCQEKEQRLLDKLACVIEEQRLRKDGLVSRTGTHTFEYYHLDYVGGSINATGTRFPTDIAAGGGNATIDSVSTTDLVDAALSGETIVAGDFIYNVTQADSTTVSSFTSTTITCAKDIAAASWAGTDEYYLIRAWKNINKATTTEIRMPGDKVFFRAGVTWNQGTEAVNVEFDENGDEDNYIELIRADSGTNDKWSDGSDVKPTIDFQNGTFNFNFSGDRFWRLNGLIITQSNDSSGAIALNGADYLYVLSCDIQNGNNGAGEGISAIDTELFTVDSCTFENTNGISLSVGRSVNCVLTNSTFTAGGDVGSTFGLRLSAGGCCWAKDCTFTGSFGTVDIAADLSTHLFMRNMTRVDTDVTILNGGQAYSEDDDGTFESHITTFGEGTITRGTTSPRAGGADSFAIMTPTSLCGPNRPLRLGDRLAGFARVWKTAGSYTATVYARVDSAWDSALSAAECYMITSELDNAGNATRVERQSTETINNDTTWTAFTTSVTPAREGWIYFWFYLGKFEDSSEAVDVDMKVAVA